MPEAADPNRDPEEVRRRLAILDRWCGENAGAYAALWLSCELCEDQAAYGTNAARACAAHNAGFPPLPELPPEVAADLVAAGCGLPPAPPANEPVAANLPIQWEIGASGANPDGSPRALDSDLNRIIKPPQIIRPDEAAAAMPKLPPAGRLCGGCRWFDRRPAERVFMGRTVAGQALQKMSRYGTVDPTRMGSCGVRGKGVCIVYDTAPDCGRWEPGGRLVSFRGQENHG